MKNPPAKSKLLVLGLGNPGKRFLGTRHNTGFRVIELLMKQLDLRYKPRLFAPYRLAQTFFQGEKIHGGLILAEPLTFMNRSGAAVPGLLRRFQLKPENLLVVCDNLDLPPGALRLKKKGSAGGQKGLQSVTDALGHGDFPRLFVGIGRPLPGETVVEHVLGIPRSGEAEALRQGESRAADAILELTEKPFDQVTGGINGFRPRSGNGRSAGTA